MYGDNLATAKQELGSTTAWRFGFWAALLTSTLTLITFGIAVLTPPLSGPGCTTGCFSYPYADIASRFPRDYLWMMPALLQWLAFIALVVAIHHTASRDRRVFTHLALGVALVGSATLALDYALQLIVLQPSVLAGEADGVAMLSQFNPHGVFIGLEEFGYVSVAVALLCLAPVFGGASKVERAARWLFVACFAAVVVAFVWISAVYGLAREYRFEIAVITVDFLALIVAGFLLAAIFRRGLRSTPLHV